MIDAVDSADKNLHRVKSVRNCIYSGPHFPTFGLNTEIYAVPFTNSKNRKGKQLAAANSNSENPVTTKVVKKLEFKVHLLKKHNTFFSIQPRD